MSNAVRPYQRTPKQTLAALLNGTRKLVGGDRFENLYQAIRAQVVSLKNSETRLLDYGCGTMDFSVRLKKEGVIQHFTGMDIYPKPGVNANSDAKWNHYQQVTAQTLLTTAGGYDVAIVLDVLHHATPDDRIIILQRLATMSKVVVVKDHFEYGYVSRQLLRLADWFGNYAYGVDIPDRYFDRTLWKQIIADAGLKEVKLITPVRVHDGLFGILLSQRYHFISVLKKNDN
jgi:Methyltransferase domain